MTWFQTSDGDAELGIIALRRIYYDTIAGESSDTSTYTTADRIKSYEAQGYTLVSNNFP